MKALKDEEIQKKWADIKVKEAKLRKQKLAHVQKLNYSLMQEREKAAITLQDQPPEFASRRKHGIAEIEDLKLVKKISSTNHRVHNTMFM